MHPFLHMSQTDTIDDWLAAITRVTVKMHRTMTTAAKKNATHRNTIITTTGEENCICAPERALLSQGFLNLSIIASKKCNYAEPILKML